MNRIPYQLLVGVFAVAPATLMAAYAAVLGTIGVWNLVPTNPGGSLLVAAWMTAAFYGYAALWRLALGWHPWNWTTRCGLLGGIVAAAPAAMLSTNAWWRLMYGAPIAVAAIALVVGFVAGGSTTPATAPTPPMRP